MTSGGARVGVGTRFTYDGETVEVVEMKPSAAGNEVVVRSVTGQSYRRLPLKELLFSDRARLIPDMAGPSSDDTEELAAVVLAELTEFERQDVCERAGHVREVLTGYRSGNAVLALPNEPRPEYCTDVPLLQRYASKAQELGVGSRTIQRWVHLFQKFGEAGLIAQREPKTVGLASKFDERWAEIAVEVMVEHTEQSRPSRTMVIERTNARVVARFGEGVVALPSRSAAFRALRELEKRYPTFG